MEGIRKNKEFFFKATVSLFEDEMILHMEKFKTPLKKTSNIKQQNK